MITATIERVVVFNDGHALITKRVTARTDSRGHIEVRGVPSTGVVYGCLWVKSASGRALPMTVTTVAEEGFCVTMAELLRANKGRRARLTLQGNEVLEGTIADVLEKDVLGP